MGFFSAVKRFFSGGSQPAEEVKQKEAPEESPKDEGTGPAEKLPNQHIIIRIIPGGCDGSAGVRIHAQLQILLHSVPLGRRPERQQDAEA